MPHQKIATCCYCGTRAALVLRGDTRHELSCVACGAPLHDLKGLKAQGTDRHGPTPAPRIPTGPVTPAHYRKKSRKKKRKPLSRRLLGEAFDLIEDLLD
ncbi:MAG: hypothetical protein ACK5IB_06575 [Qingshengfaniella sp.]